METSTSSLNLYQDYVDFNSNQTSDGVTFYDVDDVGSWNYSLFEFDSALFWNAYIRYHNLDPRHRWKMPQYYSLAYQIIGTIFQGIIFSVGLLGNIMVVIVVLRSRGMRTPTNCYLMSLAVADSMVLVSSVPNEIIAYYLLGDKWLWGRFGCALFIFFQYLGINASSLSIAAFTVERYIAICHPMLAHKLCTVRRAKRIILYVWTFATFYCAPWLFLTKTERIYYVNDPNVFTCKFALNREDYKIYYLTDIVLFYICPLLMSCVLYALIARILYQNDIVRKNNKSTAGSTKLGASGSDSSGSTLKLNQCHAKRNTSNSDSSRVQVVKMLAVVVAVFATLWLPYRALVVYNSFAYPPYMELWYLMFAKTMIFVNSAINPIIYSACSIKFRREFKRMLTCTNGSSYYYRSHRTGGNGTTFSAAVPGGGGGGAGALGPAIALERQRKSLSKQNSSSLSNLRPNPDSTEAEVAREYLSPAHALRKANNRNGNVLRTSASINQMSDSTESEMRLLQQPQQQQANNAQLTIKSNTTSFGNSTTIKTSITLVYKDTTDTAATSNCRVSEPGAAKSSPTIEEKSI